MILSVRDNWILLHHPQLSSQREMFNALCYEKWCTGYNACRTDNAFEVEQMTSKNFSYPFLKTIYNLKLNELSTESEP